MATKLEWDNKYSVGVEEIDNQHKHMFETINQLLEAINTNTPQDKLGEIINRLIEYKMYHFATEERYFEEFKYEGAAEHIAEHHKFNERLQGLRAKYPEPTIELAFELVDFLEDWLINHLMSMDQKYVQCFHEHGLK